MKDPELAGRLMQMVAGLELDSADGRAGVKALLREIEAASPGSVEQMAAHLQLRRMGLNTSTAH